MASDATRVVHAGLPAPAPEAPFLPGPTFAAPYHLTGDPAGRDFVYGRYANPTWAAWEAALGELEGGSTVAFASGMAAVTGVLWPLLGPGDVLVLPGDGYPAVRTLAAGPLARAGVEPRFVPSADAAYLDAIDGARLVWIESPTNPRLDVLDVVRLAEAAHAAGALVAVDNTLATPLAQRPLALGADLSVSSASKHLTGHSDLVLGYAAARDPELVAGLRAWRTQTGAIPGPMEAWLAHRSLATLDVRLRRQCANASALAELLSARPDVLEVRYPGLPRDPAHAAAARLLAHFGSVVSFTLADRGRAERFLAAAELIADATSFGGVHTSAERRARWGTDAVPDGFIRLSAGIEAAEDLLGDVEGALDAAAAGA